MKKVITNEEYTIDGMTNKMIEELEELEEKYDNDRTNMVIVTIEVIEKI